MKKFPLSAFQKAALQRIADEGEVIGTSTVTMSSLVRRGLVIAEEIEGSEKQRFRLATVQTVGDLITQLQKLDPTMRVGLPGRCGGLVKPITELTEDTLHVAPEDRTFATLGRFLDQPGFRGMDLKKIGPILIFE